MHRYEEQKYFAFIDKVEEQISLLIEKSRKKKYKKDFYDSLCSIKKEIENKPKFVVYEDTSAIVYENNIDKEFNVGDVVWVYERVYDDSIYGKVKGPIKITQKVKIQDEDGEKVEYYLYVENNRYCGPSRIIGSLFNSEMAANEKRVLDAHLFIEKEMEKFNSGKTIDANSLRKLAESIGEKLIIERK